LERSLNSMLLKIISRQGILVRIIQNSSGLFQAVEENGLQYLIGSEVSLTKMWRRNFWDI
jgi:diphthamide biosynthesis methyltransferase